MPSSTSSLVNRWYCPACGFTDVTRPVPNRWHTCPKLRGLTAPLLREGVRAKVEVREREDYVGDELVVKDADGKDGAMSIVTTRDDGTDVAVFAPTARGGVHA